MSTTTPSQLAMGEGITARPQIRVMIVSPRNLATLESVLNEVSDLDEPDD